MEQQSSHAPLLNEQTFVFPATEVSIALPIAGSAVRGVIDGTWTTQATSRTEFEVTALQARLTIPLDIDRTLDPAPPRSMEIRVDRAEFEPAFLQNGCQALNHGRYDPESRSVSSTIGMVARLPFGESANIRQSFLILHTVASFGAEAFQVGAGVGVAISGLLRGAIFCCAAGPRERLRDEAPPKPPRPIGEGSHLEIELPVAVVGNPTDDAKKLTARPSELVRHVVKQTLDLFRRAGILQDLARQIEKDGLPGIKVTIVVRMDNPLSKEIPPISAHTECHDDFVGIEIDAKAILEPYADDIIESFWDTLAHELIHAKQCAYEKAKKPLPYDGHESKEFKDKVKEMVAKAKARADADQKAWEDEFHKAFK